MARGTKLTPLGDLLKRYGIKPKTWRDFVESGLIEPATERIPGRKSYALRPSQVARLSQIVSAKRRLKKRYTLSGLAFQLALNGDRSHSGLVKHEIEKKVRTFWGTVSRGLQRYAGLEADHTKVSDTDLHAAARLIAKKMSKRHSGSKRDAIRGAFQVILYILLSMMYGRHTDALLGSSRSVEQLLLSIASFNDKQLGWIGMARPAARALATTLVSMLANTRDAMSIDERRNPVFRSLAEIPEEQFWQLFEVWPKVMKAIWSAADRSKTFLPVPDLDAGAREHLGYVYLGALIAHYKTGSAEVYDEFYRGSCASFVKLVDQLVAAAEIAVTAQKLMSARRAA